MRDVRRHVVRRALAIVAFITITVGVAATFVWPSLSTYLWPTAAAAIEDASRPIDVRLRAPQESKAVYALDVVGVGRLEGEGEIALVLNGALYKPQHLSGCVLFTWRGDWYSPEAVVRYTPAPGASGSMALNYRFHSL